VAVETHAVWDEDALGRGDRRHRARGVPSRCHPAATRTSRRGGRALSPSVPPDVGNRAAWPALSARLSGGTRRDPPHVDPDRREDQPALARWQEPLWQVALHLTARGLATGPMPYGSRTLAWSSIFVEHEARPPDGRRAVHESPAPALGGGVLPPLSQGARTLAIRVTLWPTPVEVEHRFALPTIARTRRTIPSTPIASGASSSRPTTCSKRFRGRFLGKCSPVHFFWGSFDSR